ncbi:MAG: hypothetical protein F4164_12380 [Gemmatimonadales bacterium]|nr:hypothetical protein [Gemmatimonadales bacterium]MYG50129.1 hypothetical protein [Gemmatimonadales bacterium]MYK02486.1 hypothetical protein [Candidatus Palauibacter ramosifaciens]
MYRAAGVITFLAATVAGCGDSRRVHHPLPEAIAELEREATTVILPDTVPPPTMNAEKAARWIAMRRAILAARPGATIGTLDRDGPELLGSILRVKLAHDGEILILDSMNGRVVAFGSDGTTKTWFGRLGDGPMELRTARDLERYGDSLFVAQSGLLKIYGRTHRGYEWRGEMPLPVEINSICVLASGIFGITLGAPATAVRRLSVFGENDLAFGRGYTHGWEFAQRRLSTGLGTCVGTPARIIHGFEELPALRAYSPSGVIQWSATFKDYWQGYWIETPGRASLQSPMPPHEILMGLDVIGRGFVVATYLRVDQRGEFMTRAYLLDAETGEGGLVEETTRPDRQIMAAGRHQYVTYIRGLYPRFRIWHMDELR